MPASGGARASEGVATTLEHRYITVNGVTLHTVWAGPEGGPLVVLLHGFPEFWYSWRRQLSVLAEAGYRVIAPDMRGYNLSDKPAGLEAYRMERLTGDVAALIRQAGREGAAVVGHDWGGVVAWHLPLHHPEVTARLVVMNAPHPAHYARELRRASQLMKSWYVLFFQLPYLPEAMFRRGGKRLLERVFRQGSRLGSFSDEDLGRYAEALSQPGALTASLNYYRALVRRGPARRESFKIGVPTLLLWGERDCFLNASLSEGLEPFVPDLRVLRFPEASHWLQLDAAEAVNEVLLEFLAGRARPDAKG